jgi:hypothetical protein
MARAGRRLALVALAAAGCAGSVRPGPPPEAPIGDDVVALLPSVADAVVDIDVAQLNGWPTARHNLGLLPPAGKERLARLGVDPLADVSALAIGLYRAGAPDAETTMVARGTLDWDKLRATVDGGVETEYHGAALVDGAHDAVARVTPSVFAFGSRAAVRRVCDVAQKDDDGLRSATLDKPLRTALGRAPTAKLGRPAIMAALVPTPALRERMRKEDWASAAELDWIALSFAVGDGFDVGIIAGAHGEAEAATLAKAMKSRAHALTTQATVRLLGLVPFVKPFIVVSKDNEVHVAYRLAEARVDQLVGRLEQMQGIAQKRQAQAAGARP